MSLTYIDCKFENKVSSIFTMELVNFFLTKMEAKSEKNLES